MARHGIKATIKEWVREEGITDLEVIKERCRACLEIPDAKHSLKSF